MNSGLAERFAESYRRVLLDNRSSVEAALHLELAGVPVDRAEEYLAAQCRLFNPSKHGKGELPRSLAYFERGILKAWRNQAQLEIPLLQLESPAPRIQEYSPEPDRPPATEAQLAQFRAEYDRAANDPNTPRIHA